MSIRSVFHFFFFNDTATTEIYTLSLHDALPIWRRLRPFEEMRARRANALNVSVVKEALAQLGLCRPDVRPPITPLTEAERAEVGTILADLGVASPAAA